MRGKVFLVVWNAIEAEMHRQRLAAQDWRVIVEHEDPGRAYEFIQLESPDVLVIHLDRDPAFGHKVARSIHALDAFRDLPIVFVNGSPEEVERARRAVPPAYFTTTSDRSVVLDRIVAQDAR